MRTSNMQNTLSSDFYKITKYKSIWVTLIIIVVIIILLFAVTVITNNAIDQILESGEEYNYTGKDFLYSTHNVSCSMIQILMAITICIFVGNEFHSGMIRTYVARGTKRLNIYFSKLILVAVLSILYCCISLILSGIFTAIYGFGMEFNGNEFGILIRSFFLQYLAMMSFLSICLMFVFIFRSTGTSIGAGIGIYIAFDLIISIILALLNVSNSNTDWVNFLPLQQQSIASSYSSLSTTNLIAVVIMPIVYICLSSFIGIITFLKRDIK